MLIKETIGQNDDAKSQVRRPSSPSCRLIEGVSISILIVSVIFLMWASCLNFYAHGIVNPNTVLWLLLWAFLAFVFLGCFPPTLYTGEPKSFLGKLVSQTADSHPFWTVGTPAATLFLVTVSFIHFPAISSDTWVVNGKCLTGKIAFINPFRDSRSVVRTGSDQNNWYHSARTLDGFSVKIETALWFKLADDTAIEQAHARFGGGNFKEWMELETATIIGNKLREIVSQTKLKDLEPTAWLDVIIYSSISDDELKKSGLVWSQPPRITSVRPQTK